MKKAFVFILSFSVTTTPAFAELPEGEISHKTEEAVKTVYSVNEVSQIQEQIIKDMQEKFEQIDSLDTDNEVKEAQKIYLVLKIAQNFEAKDDKLFQKSIENALRQEQEKAVKTGDIENTKTDFGHRKIERISSDGFNDFSAVMALVFGGVFAGGLFLDRKMSRLGAPVTMVGAVGLAIFFSLAFAGYIEESLVCKRSKCKRTGYQEEVSALMLLPENDALIHIKGSEETRQTLFKIRQDILKEINFPSDRVTHI